MAHLWTGKVNELCVGWYQIIFSQHHHHLVDDEHDCVDFLLLEKFMSEQDVSIHDDGCIASRHLFSCEENSNRCKKNFDIEILLTQLILG